MVGVPSVAGATIRSEDVFIESKLRVHHGAIDQNAVTPRQPQEIMDEIRKVLWNLGIEAQRDGEFKVKCIRKGKKKGDDNSPSVSHPQPPTAYGESSVDSGDEIRFSIELTRLKNLTGLYSVDIRRIKGQLWGFGWVYNQVLQNMQLNNSSEAPREE
ncbi:hypothetical protein BT69DRAFT_1267292 [Atractiella rhizophila]|nr:hypothetical protein BT69DRAFT_1267292 [Atractiella rhizophila]